MAGAQTAAASSRIVYRLNPEMTLVENDDTLIWIRSANDSGKQRGATKANGLMTITFLLKGDSTFVLMHGKRTPLVARWARHVRVLRSIARDERSGKQRLAPFPN